MKILLIIYGILLLIIFAEPIFEDVFNLATLVGCGFGVATLLCGIFWSELSLTAKKYTAFFILLISAFVGTLMLIIKRKGITNAEGQKTILVLGCSVKWDKPSLSLIKRVDAAYSFLLSNPDSVAILSGGQGRDEAMSEAKCMHDMLVERGIFEDRLIIEDKSTTTNENIKYCARLMKQHNLPNTVAIATSEYHQLRSAIICRKYGIVPYAKSSKTKFTILPTFLLREVFAIVKALLF